MKYIFYSLLAVLIFLTGCNPETGIMVNNADEFHEALKNANEGDRIILANGIWENAELLVDAKGSRENPVYISAEEKGKVIFTGLSNLRISGEFVEISGLVFKNGYTPTSEVISFREKKGVYAENCRLTECVIDNYNNPERFSTESWVVLYGRNNRVDHCILKGKRTRGVTLTVRLVDEDCRNNNHLIDHNYFGYRQSLGSNGGETLRIGTSHYSLTTSATFVENNYFDRCGGELEIISNKSCGNSFINNTFFECKGTLTYRHGHDNHSEGNFFFGNGMDNTGGIRIINERNTAVNNYFYGLKGYRFRGALVIMNGVPNSPINRYNQVIGGRVSNNTFINCDHIQLCAGSDDERSLTPVETSVDNNLFYNEYPHDLFTVYDDISGISFINNFANSSIEPLKGIDFKLLEGEPLPNDHGIRVADYARNERAGCLYDSAFAKKNNTGVNWYVVTEEELLFDEGKEISVEPGLNTLFDAVSQSDPGDILILQEGEYENSKELKIFHPLTIKSSVKESSTLFSEKTNMFIIENQGALKLKGLLISGSRSPDMAGNSIISTSKYSMNRNYKLIVEDCSVENLDVNHSFDFLRIYKNTFADTLMIKNCIFSDVSGNIAALDKETDDIGIYNAEYVIYENNDFKNIGGTILSLYRGGTDESTFGPVLRINNCSAENSGFDKRNKLQVSVYLHGVQMAQIKASSFISSAPLKFHFTNGEPQMQISGLNIYPKTAILANRKAYTLEGLSHNESY